MYLSVLLKTRILDNEIAALIRPIVIAYGLTNEQWLVLLYIDSHTNATSKVIGQDTCFLAPSLSRMFPGFIELGYIKATKDPEDARVIFYNTTRKGARVVKRVAAKLEEINDNVKGLITHFVESMPVKDLN